MGNINIPNVTINRVGIPNTSVWLQRQPYVPNVDPITNYIGFPIINIPGCVWMHKDNKKHKNGVPIDKSLVVNDPGKAMTVCDAGMPYFNTMDYSDTEC